MEHGERGAAQLAGHDGIGHGSKKPISFLTVLLGYGWDGERAEPAGAGFGEPDKGSTPHNLRADENELADLVRYYWSPPESECQGGFTCRRNRTNCPIAAIAASGLADATASACGRS